MYLPPFYPILDTETAARKNCSVEALAEALLDAGAKILQFRHKGHYSRAVFEQAERIAALCRNAGAVLVIDDRADIALLLSGGLHVGQDDLAPRTARGLMGEHTILGFSTHNESQLTAAAAEPADYLAIGPIFPTGSKRNPDAVVGVEELRRLRSLVRAPLVAIGGIDRSNATAVLAAGADSVAIIADLYPGSTDLASLRARAADWMKVTGREAPMLE